jgi:hypothetical protein
MSLDRTVRQLTSLDQFQIDVVKAYDQALHHLDEPALREELYRIKADIERHILEISEVLRALGHEPPMFARDLRGYLMACIASLRSAGGGEGALRALRAIVAASTERYRQTIDVGDLPREVLQMLEAHLSDLQRHHDALDGMVVHSSTTHSPPGEPDL